MKISRKEIEERIFVEVEEIKTPKQTIFDPRDPSIKLGIKGSKSWVGSKCHVVETADKGKINFLTDMIYQKSNEDDSQIHGKVKEGNERAGLQPEKVYADTKYISGAAIRDYSENEQKLMGYSQDGRSKRPEDFKVSKFSVDMNTLKAVCPAGQESVKSSVLKNGKINIYFSAKACGACSFFQDCVNINRKTKLTKRVLTVGPDHAYIQERRIEQKTENFKTEMRVRSQIEGTISEATRYHGLRNAKYKGEAGHKLQFYLTGAALNVKRLIKALNNGRDLVQMTKA